MPVIHCDTGRRTCNGDIITACELYIRKELRILATSQVMDKVTCKNCLKRKMIIITNANANAEVEK
jgi:hypothetical protein